MTNILEVILWKIILHLPYWSRCPLETRSFLSSCCRLPIGLQEKHAYVILLVSLMSCSCGFLIQLKRTKPWKQQWGISVVSQNENMRKFGQYEANAALLKSMCSREGIGQ